MKNILKSLILVLVAGFLSGNIYAQANRSTTENEIKQKAQQKVEMLNKELHFTESQLPKVKELLTNMEFKRAEGGEKAETLNAIEQTELANIINDQQMKQYKVIMERGKANSPTHNE
jgi:hypothetical protein